MSENIIGTGRDETARTAATPAARRAVTALTLALLGGLMVYGAGFAGTAVLHDAAHDTRHAFAFPCH